MITPQEIQERVFDKAVFGGYDMSGVDAFLDRLSDDYGALYKENAVLKSKMKLLVETVEEYRSVDDQMRKALLAAQRMAEETKSAAEIEAKKIIDAAREKGKEEISSIKASTEAEERRLELTKKETTRTLAMLKEIFTKQLALIDSIPGMEIKPPQPKNPQVAEKAREIENSMNSRFTRSEPEPDPLPFMAAARENVPVEDEEEDIYDYDAEEDSPPDRTTEQSAMPEVFEFHLNEEIPELQDSEMERDPYDTGEIASPKPKFDFGELQFGNSYSVIGKKKEKQ